VDGVRKRRNKMRITYLDKNGYSKSVTLDTSKWDIDTPYKISTCGFWIEENKDVHHNSLETARVGGTLIPPSRIVCIEILKEKEEQK
jgi:hypothetical protein